MTGDFTIYNFLDTPNEVWQRCGEIPDFTAQEELIAKEGVFISIADPEMDWS